MQLVSFMLQFVVGIALYWLDCKALRKRHAAVRGGVVLGALLLSEMANKNIIGKYMGRES